MKGLTVTFTQSCGVNTDIKCCSVTSVDVVAQLNECQLPPGSYKTRLSCSPEVTSRGSEVTCRVTCEAGARFASDQLKYVTRCGPETGFRWTHENTSRLLPSCSGTAAGCHGNRVIHGLYTNSLKEILMISSHRDYFIIRESNKQFWTMQSSVNWSLVNKTFTRHSCISTADRCLLQFSLRSRTLALLSDFSFHLYTQR